MMFKQTPEFLAGYVFCNIEEKVMEFLNRNECERFTAYTDVPKIWFHPTLMNLNGDIPEKIPNKVGTKCCNALNDMFDKYVVEYKLTSLPHNIRFTFTFTKKDIPKCMTMSEIEEALGYKITLIKEQQ